MTHHDRYDHREDLDHDHHDRGRVHFLGRDANKCDRPADYPDYVKRGAGFSNQSSS